MPRLPLPCALLCALLPALLPALSVQAQAPAWKPATPVEIVNPAAPGGSVDLMCRSLKKFLEDNKLVDVPVNVVYKTGANGAIALDYVNQQQGSGETLFAIAHTFLTIRLTGESKQDWRDLTPVGILFKEFHVTAVRADSPIRDGRDLIARMRADPSAISYGFFGNRGNHLHLAAAIPFKAAGVDIRRMTTVPYRSGPEAMSAVLGGHLDVALVSAVNPAGNVQAGKMRVLTQTMSRRGEGYLKDVPTWKELGVDVEYATAQGFAGPKGMRPEAVAFWQSVLGRMAKDPEWQKLLDRSLWVSAYMDAAEMRRYYASEFDKLSAILGELGLAKGQ
jgi:putative tricarboxylic transport membrane protein